MTISSLERVTEASFDGMARSFPFAWKWHHVGDIVVETRLPEGEWGVLPSGVWGLVLGLEDHSGGFTGGVVTYPLEPGSPLASGQIRISRRVEPLQTAVQLTATSGYDPRVVEWALDHLTMICQQLSDDFGYLNDVALDLFEAAIEAIHAALIGIALPGRVRLATNMTTLRSILADGDIALLRSDQTYTWADAWTIPSGARIIGSAPLTYTGPENLTYLTAGTNVFVEDLNVTVPGAQSVSPGWTFGEGLNAGRIRIRPLAETGLSTMVHISGNSRIGLFDTEGIARPLLLGDISEEPTLSENITIGKVHIRDYIRAIRVNRVDGWSISSFDIQTRHPSAVLNSAGHNAFLLSGGSRWSLTNGIIEGAAEHAIRLAGDETFATEHVKITNVSFENCEGCPIKINANHRVKHVNISDVSVLGQHMDNPGGNADIFRISHAEDVTIDGVTVKLGDTALFSGAHFLSVNDVEAIRARNISFEGLSGRLFIYDVTHDVGEGLGEGLCDDVVISDVYGDLSDSGSLSLISAQGSAESTFGDFTLTNARFVFPNAFDFVSYGNGTTLVEGAIRRLERVTVYGVANPNFNENVPDGDWQLFSVSADESTYSGPNEGITLKRGRYVAYGEAFSNSDTDSNRSGFLVSSVGEPSGEGAWGGAYLFLRPGSERRGGAIAVRQDTADPNFCSLRFFVPGTTAASDALVERLAITRDGHINITSTQAQIQMNGVKVLGEQRPAIANPTGGATVDAEARAQLVLVLNALRNMGIIAT